MSSFDDFMANLSPAVRKNTHTVAEVERFRFPTPVVGLNWALGGGFLAGGVSTVFGGSGSSKSTLMLMCIALWQSQGYTCGVVDSEGTITNEHAQRLGVDITKLVYCDFKGIRQATDTMTTWLRAGIDIIIVDTISDLLPAVFEDKDGNVKEFDDTKQVGASAKSIRSMIMALHYSMKPNQLVILVSQTTTEIGTTYTKQIPHGGKKIEFNSSQMVQLTSSRAVNQQLKSKIDGAPIGREITATVLKNKGGAEFRTINYNLYYGDGLFGIDRAADLVAIGIKQSVVFKSGAWLDWNGERHQGKDQMAAWLRENPENMDILEKDIMKALDGVDNDAE